eukprot:1150105-Pelagomonas_calceolata.AAC.2
MKPDQTSQHFAEPLAAGKKACTNQGRRALREGSHAAEVHAKLQGLTSLQRKRNHISKEAHPASKSLPGCLRSTNKAAKPQPAMMLMVIACTRHTAQTPDWKPCPTLSGITKTHQAGFLSQIP